MNYLKSNFVKQKQMVLSPSLFIYKPTLESLYSILIRIFGCFLFIAFLILVLSLGDSFLLGEFFFSLKGLLGETIYLYMVRFIYIIYPPILIGKNLFFSLFLFITLIFLLNHSHLGYRHSLIRGKFKGNFAYPFQRWLIYNLNFLEKIFHIIITRILIQESWVIVIKQKKQLKKK